MTEAGTPQVVNDGAEVKLKDRVGSNRVTARWQNKDVCLTDGYIR